MASTQATKAMSAVSIGQVVALDAAAKLHSIRQQRASDLREIREDLRRLARNGGFSAQELFDLVTCLQSCMPITGDMQDIRSSLVDIACDLDGYVHGYRSEA